jgi:putative addiction module component (TIGR02574 family)
MNTQILQQARMLDIDEQIALVEAIWNSIAAEASDTVGLSQIQRAELHRRVAAHRADPSTAVPWKQVRSKLFPSKPDVGRTPSRGRTRAFGSAGLVRIKSAWAWL